MRRGSRSRWAATSKLTPRQQGEPLNYLIYPYVEVDGKPLPKESIKNHFEYADMAN